MRCIMANNKPMVVAFDCWWSGSLFAAIDINTMLSIPNIISKKVSVNKAIIASLVKRKSITVFIFQTHRTFRIVVHYLMSVRVIFNRKLHREILIRIKFLILDINFSYFLIVKFTRINKYVSKCNTGVIKFKFIKK